MSLEFHWTIIFCVDGTHKRDKINELIERRKDELPLIKKIYEVPTRFKVSTRHLPDFERFFLSMITSLGFQCHHAVYEADDLLTSLIQSKGAEFIITNDSDFFLSDARFVMKADDFVYNLTKIVESGSDALPERFEVLCVDTKFVKEYFLRIEEMFYPYFSCLVGNSNTSKYALLYTHHLGLNLKENQQLFNINEILLFLRTFTSEDELLSYMKRRPCKYDKDFFGSLEETKMALNPPPETQNEQAPLNIDQIGYKTCAKMYVNTIELVNYKFLLTSVIFGNPNRQPIYTLTEKLRALIYGFFLKEDVTEARQVGDSLSKVKVTPITLMDLNSFNTRSQDEKVQIILQSLFTPHLQVTSLYQQFTKDNVWKAVLITYFLWIKQNSDFSLCEVIIGFNTIAQLITDPSKKVYTPNLLDDRSPLHIINVYSSVSTCFLEFFIDFCELPSSIASKLYIETIPFCRYYNSVVFTEAEYKTLVETSDLYAAFDTVVLH
ncbi:hypothetical protein EIN_248810 [Entamoeba invadens IP1]|uniref:Asteroid domain-containing protein n=1 Tax=Entamoeba invadens IP1 TaxID=370355 RepID=A0A0A1UH82_ENTIV|nr:hypothetical protein EIN_248810 [Entamoeba invadens IP1]ELP94867.1 hypothetical protein EIN_248810 [Entamoeba invadens IP1]|eukprot:XP_004261638.1 hypothetical protein EIN_248810 [Entamoeba invadens IP1]